MKKEYFNIFRVVCAFAVVLLHANEGTWFFSYDSYWIEATVVFTLFYFAAPCFIMISGALLIDYYKRNTKEGKGRLVLIPQRLCRLYL